MSRRHYSYQASCASTHSTPISTSLVRKRPFAAFAMPASIAGSAANTPNKKIGSRQERCMVKQLANGLASNKEYTKQTDLSYIVGRLEDEDADLVADFATLLRNGTLRKAVDTLTGRAEAEGLGKELAPSQTSFRSLRDATLDALLTEFEPKLFNDEALKVLSRDKKFQLTVFALGVSPKEALPSLSPALRYTTVLAKYCMVRYKSLGRRLKGADINDLGSIGYFAIDGNQVKLRIKKPSDEPFSSAVKLDVIGLADDWSIQNNYTVAAILVSAKQCIKINLLERFAAEQQEPPPAESLEWSIPMDKWPREMARAGSLASASEPQANEAGPPAPSSMRKRPRAGDGKVSAKAKAKAKAC